jgi:hypothetical protein
VAGQGKYIGDAEYGRLPYAGVYIGDAEHGRLPGIGYTYTPELRVLTVESAPQSGVEITVSPNDIYGNGNGTTTFERTYNDGTDVTLTAPATFGALVFSTWKVDGAPVEGNPIVVPMGADHTALVEYEEAPAPPPEEIKGTEMLYVKLPRKKYWTSEYPNLDPNAVGRPIPIAWGEIKNAPATCIDTSLMKFKLMDNYGRAIKAVDQVRIGEDVLVSGVDYDADLNNAEITIAKTPVLEPNTTYYFVLESDYPINGIDYLRFAQGYAYAHNRYDIDGAGVWTLQSYSLFFMVIVKDSLDGQPYVLIDNINVNWNGWNMLAHLRDTTARTRIGQKIVTPATGGPWYLYDIKVDPRMAYGGPVGNPPASRITKITVLSSYNPDVQVGSKSYRMEDYPPAMCDGYYPQRSVEGDVKVDFKAVMNADASLMENVADILKDSYVTILGGSESALDSAALAALKAARTEKLNPWLDEEVQYREFLDKLEGGQFFKFLPTLDWKFTVLYAQAGEPSGTIHFRDEDILSFRCFRKWSSIYQKVKIRYAENPGTNEWQVREAESNVAAYCYRVQRTLETETFLSADADGQACANEYRDLIEAPLRVVEFETAAGKGFGLIPWQKIKVTRARAEAPGGKLEGVLFRVLEAKQNPLSGHVTITAVLDEQTY